ncbi:NADH-quinone oxidoreductase subunit L [Planctomicrobium sp. SH664]|uniref:NADH-quinone oxidoreductase subunit L n=1 Tax=Planctomicrobium sp. SH664 TaxID=3448125 RepID=UPI003F5B8EE9
MSDSTKELILWLIPGAPLVSAVLTGLLGPKLLKERSHVFCWTALAVAFVCSVITLVSSVPSLFSAKDTFIATGYEFFKVGGLNVRIDLAADAVTALMLVMVTGVSFLVSVFASGYMHGDRGYARFFAAVSMFVFSMCFLVLSSNFVMLFAGWELVGLCSYLLIGFWFQKPSAAAAAKKAFVVNRVGDFGFLLGILLIWTTFGSVNFLDVLGNPQRIAEIAAANPCLITTICLLLFLGAMGKSAQFPLQVWLPDAMEGPTPVSALIHAATMVTAGVYMVTRCTPLFVHSPTAQVIVASVGAITALIAALTALTQNDLKRVLAYSTVSQLGFMFMALGAGVGGMEAATFAVTAGMFHLYTHAFFKALLFLAAGSVMHSMGDIIDMRRFSGLRKVLPITHWTFLCGAAALAGVPLLAGFWSKDDILAVLSAATHHEDYGTYYKIIFGVAAFSALLTAFYTFRAYFMTFWGEEKIPEEAGHHPHDAPPAMAIPLRILALFALFAGLVLGPTHLFLNYLGHTQGLVEVHPHGLHLSLMLISALIAGAGIAGAWYFYVAAPALPGQIAKAIKPLYLLSLNKFYLDEILWAIVVAPLRAVAWLATLFDKGVIDNIVDGVGHLPRLVSAIPRRLQNGLIPSYSMVMWTGVVLGVLLMLGKFW